VEGEHAGVETALELLIAGELAAVGVLRFRAAGHAALVLPAGAHVLAHPLADVVANGGGGLVGADRGVLGGAAAAVELDRVCAGRALACVALGLAEVNVFRNS